MHPTPVTHDVTAPQPDQMQQDAKKSIQPDAKENNSQSATENTGQSAKQKDGSDPGPKDPATSHMTCRIFCGMAVRAWFGLFECLAENFGQGDNFSAESTRRRTRPKRISARTLDMNRGEEFDYNSLTEDQQKRLIKSFRHFDRDGSGYISTKELSNMMQLMGHNPTRGDIMDILDDIDIDKNGTVDFKEFAQAWWITERIHMERDAETELRMAFDIFDKDGDDLLDIDELSKILMQVGDPMTQEEVRELFTEADTNGDGTIAFSEFKAMKCWQHNNR